MSKQDKKELRQLIACEWLEENHLQVGSLRHDVVTDRLQVRCAHNLGDEAIGRLGERQETWRNLTDKDINTMVCQCVAEKGVNISTNEMWTALKSDMVPAVHPLRAWLEGLKPYTADQPDWIDFVARQVRVKNNDDKVSGNNNDNTDNLRPNQYPLGAQGEDKNQQPKQLDPTTCSARNNTASGEGYDLNDNNDNLQSTPKSRLFRGPRGNQLPAALKENTPCRSRDVLISPKGSNDRSAYDSSGTLSKLSSNNDSSLTSNNNHSLSSPNNPADRLWRGCFKKWFVAMVASWMKDEVVNHTVLVLVGRQGIFKTTWLDNLIPPELRAYSSKLPLSGQISKDDRLRLCENGMLNIDELDAMCGREMNIVKSLLTSTDVNERAAYGRLKERRVRLASFCASTNKREFLTDITGNRRWLPFEVESIQNPFHTIIPYERLYAQAKALVEEGYFAYWFDMEEMEVLEAHNEEFRAQENEEELLPILFDIPAEGKGEFMTTAQISERLVTFGNIKKPMALNRLGMLLGTVGYSRVNRRIGGNKTRGWLVYQRDTDEINSLKKLLVK